MPAKRNGMKPQDVVVLFALLLIQKSDWVIAEVANAAALSASEAHAATKRLESAGLLGSLTRKPIMSAVREFLLHGLKYTFPVEPDGRTARGMPTAHSAPPLTNHIIADQDSVYVWPCAYGTARGQSVTPLYRTVPDAAQKDPDMHEFLALADAICVGRVRERELAAELLVQKLQALEDGKA